MMIDPVMIEQMNPYESPASKPARKPRQRIKNIWAWTQRDTVVVAGIVLPLLLLLLFG